MKEQNFGEKKSMTQVKLKVTCTNKRNTTLWGNPVSMLSVCIYVCKYGINKGIYI